MFLICKLFNQTQLFFYHSFLMQQFQNVKPILLIHHIILNRFNHFHKLFSLINYTFEPLLSIYPTHKFINIVFLTKSVILRITNPIQILIQIIVYFNRTLSKLLSIFQIRNLNTKIYDLLILLQKLNTFKIRLLFIASFNYFQFCTIPYNQKNFQPFLLLLLLCQQYKAFFHFLSYPSFQLFIIHMNNQNIRQFNTFFQN